MRAASYVIEGEVIEAAQGLMGAQPTTLFAIEITETYRSATQIGGLVFLAFPDAAIDIGGGLLCQRGDRYPAKPHLGRRVLIFTSKPPLAEKIFAPADDSELIFETPAGISWPNRQAIPGVTSWPKLRRSLALNLNYEASDDVDGASNKHAFVGSFVIRVPGEGKRQQAMEGIFFAIVH